LPTAAAAAAAAASSCGDGGGVFTAASFFALGHNAFTSPADRTVYVVGHLRVGSLVSYLLLLLRLRLLRQPAIAAAASSGCGGGVFTAAFGMLPYQHRQTQREYVLRQYRQNTGNTHLCTPAVATACVLLLLPLLHTDTQHRGGMLQGCLALLLLLLAGIRVCCQAAFALA
jgi:hypothetical protein